MRKVLGRNPDVVFLLLAVYFLLAIISRLLRSHSLEVDETQQAFISQFLHLGYGSQPPFYNWLQFGLEELFGMSVATLTILKNSTLFLFCLFFGLAACTLITNRSLAVMPMLGVLTLPPIFLLAQRDLSHTVAALFAVGLFLYGFFRTLKQPSLATYLITGIAVGIGLLSKYNFVVVPVAAILAVLPEKDLRARLVDWRILPALLLAVTMTLPHGWWILHNLTAATGQTLGEMKEGSETLKVPHAVDGIKDLVLAIVKGSAVPTVIFGLLFYRDLGKILRASNQWSRITGRMLLACLVIVLVIVLGIGATHIREKWLILFLVLLPLYYCLKVDASGIDPKPKLPILVTLVAVITLGALTVLTGRTIIAPMIGRYSLAHIPYTEFAQALRQSGHAEPQVIIASSTMVAGNMKVQFPKALVYRPGEDIQPPQQLAPGTSVLIVGTALTGELPQNADTELQSLARWAGVPAPSTLEQIAIAYGGKDPAKRHSFYYSWSDVPR